jgi:hypothetical protein
VDSAKICSRNDAIFPSIEIVTGFDSGVDDLLKLTRRGIIAKCVLNGSRVDVQDLLRREAECRSSSDDTVILVAPSLNLAHSLSPAIPAALVVGIDVAGL